MSAINGKTLKYGVLRSAIFVEGVGSIGPTLSAAANGMHKEAKMTVDEPWVIVEVKEKLGGAAVTVPVPIDFFSHTVLNK